MKYLNSITNTLSPDMSNWLDCVYKLSQNSSGIAA